MPSLSQCLAKAGDLFPDALADRVLSRVIELEEQGITGPAAEKQAVREVLESQEPARAEIESAIKEGRDLYGPAEEGEPQAESAMERLAAERPDMMVRLPGSSPDAPPVRLADAVEAAKAQAEDERFTAELVRVASECSLSFTG